MSILKSKWPFFVQKLSFLGFVTFKRQVGNKKYKKSERAGPQPIGQKGQLVKRSLGPKPKSQILNPKYRIPYSVYFNLYREAVIQT